MAFAHVQHTAAPADVTASPCVLAFASQNFSGSLLVALVQLDSGNAFTSISDTQVNTWSQAGAFAVSTAEVGLFYAPAAKLGANTVSVAFTGTGHTRLWLSEFTGALLAAPLDVVNTATGSGTAITGGAITATAANELIILVGQTGTLATWSVNAILTTSLDNATNRLVGMGYILSGSSGLQTPSMTLGTSGAFNSGVTAAFKPFISTPGTNVVEGGSEAGLYSPVIQPVNF